MAWYVHFGGEQLSAVNDETHETIRDQLLLAAASGSSAVIKLTTSDEHFELVWTPGVPIYFSYVDENAEE